MKRLSFIIFIAMVQVAANAEHINPMFGNGANNSVSLHIAQGTGDGTLFKLVQPFLWRIEPMSLAMIQYSQPMTILRLPARFNVAYVNNQGYESDAGLSFNAVGISWDVSFFDWNGFYIGAGLGPYMRDSADDRVASRLVFGEKFFVGGRLSDKWRMEIFTLHFSNGDFEKPNLGFNYVGLGTSYSF